PDGAIPGGGPLGPRDPSGPEGPGGRGGRDGGGGLLVPPHRKPDEKDPHEGDPEGIGGRRRPPKEPRPPKGEPFEPWFDPDGATRGLPTTGAVIDGDDRDRALAGMMVNKLILSGGLEFRASAWAIGQPNIAAERSVTPEMLALAKAAPVVGGFHAYALGDGSGAWDSWAYADNGVGGARATAAGGGLMGLAPKTNLTSLFN